MATDNALLSLFVEKLADALLRRTNGAVRSVDTADHSVGAAPRGRRKKHAKRSSLRISRTTTALLAHIKSNKGQRIEQIAAALNIPTSDLKYPAQKLLADGQVKTKGAKRGTTYFMA